MPDFLTSPLQSYLDRLASGDPTTGGGSAAGLTGAMAAALLCMSARFTIGRERYAQFQEAALAVVSVAEGLREKLQQLIEEDAVAFAQYGAATSMPKSTEDEKAVRHLAIQAATKASALAPLAIARHCAHLLRQAGVLAANCNPNLVSDVVVATQLALSGLHSAVLNVRLNLKYLDDAEFVKATAAELDTLESQAPQLAREALTTAYQVMNLPLEGV